MPPLLLPAAASREPRPLHLLVLEDVTGASCGLAPQLQTRSHLVSCVGTFAAAQMLMMDRHFDVLLSDLRLPDGHCHELIDGCAELLPRFVITMSDRQAPAFAGKLAVPRPITHHLSKPFPLDQLQALLGRFGDELDAEDLGTRTCGGVPSLVATVLREVTRRRECGELSDADFAQKLDRLTREELASRGLTLVLQPLPWGSRYLIKEARSGQVRDLVDCCRRTGRA